MLKIKNRELMSEIFTLLLFFQRESFQFFIFSIGEKVRFFITTSIPNVVMKNFSFK